MDDTLALLSGTGAPAPGLRWHPQYPLAETLDVLTMLVAAHRETGTVAASPAWWLHQILLDDLVVGDVAFHGPPPEGGPVRVEIGYDVVAGLRGRGIATRACRLILEEAWRAGAERVLAETEPDNLASQRVLLACGFGGLGYRRYVIERPESLGLR